MPFGTSDGNFFDSEFGYYANRMAPSAPQMSAGEFNSPKGTQVPSGQNFYVDRSKDVPLAASALSDKQGNMYGIAIDKDIPPNPEYEQFVYQHEASEFAHMKNLIAAGQDPVDAYHEAHDKIATPTETAAVRAYAVQNGHDPDEYLDQYKQHWRDGAKIAAEGPDYDRHPDAHTTKWGLDEAELGQSMPQPQGQADLTQGMRPSQNIEDDRSKPEFQKILDRFNYNWGIMKEDHFNPFAPRHAPSAQFASSTPVTSGNIEVPHYQTWPERALRSAIDAFTLPGDVYQGKVSDEDMIKRSANLAGTLAGGGLATAPEREAAAGIFGGALGAKTANKAGIWDRMLGRPSNEGISTKADAEALLDKGQTPTEVYKQTGWFRGPDGKMRFEISDKGARLKTENLEQSGDLGGEPWYRTPYSKLGPDLTEKKMTLGDILDHPQLYKHYPDLKDIELKSPGFNFGVQGWYSHLDNSMAIAGAKGPDMLSTILHEAQHAVQAREGFARGGNVAEFLPKDEQYKNLESVVKDSKEVEKQFWEKNIVPKFPDVSKYPIADWQFDKYIKGDRWLNADDKKVLDYIKENHPDYMRFKNLLNEGEASLERTGDEAYTKYKQLWGEAEARITQERQHLDEQMRREHDLTQTQTFRETYPEGRVPAEAVKSQYDR